MRFYALVTTVEGDDSPRLEESWPVHMVEDNLHGAIMVNRSLSEAWLEPDTLTAGVVVIEVPDADLMPLLTPRVMPTVRGTAQPPPG